jgi:hypothetical protein
MSNPRFTGLLLLLAGVLLLAGTSQDWLPAQAFWPGLLTYPIGAWLFLKGHRQASRRAERRASRALNPSMVNRRGLGYADQVLERPRPRRAPATAVDAGPELDTEEIELRDVEEAEEDRELQVSSDVSFPLEIQERSALGDQLEKLRRLRDDGIIDEEEFAAAKARLLR